MNTPRRKLLVLLALFAGLVLFQAQPADQTSANGADIPGARHTRDTQKHLEDLHRRVVAHAKADEDDQHATSRAHAAPISPERAAELALRSSGGGRLTYIELQDRQGRKAYHVKVDQSVRYVDATTGGVTRGDGQ